jgi:hypothetical protein
MAISSNRTFTTQSVANNDTRARLEARIAKLKEREKLLDRLRDAEKALSKADEFFRQGDREKERIQLNSASRIVEEIENVVITDSE